MATTALVSEAPASTVLIEVEVHHGDYHATFYGTGATVLAAAAAAAAKSSYSMGLFDSTDSFYASRARYRDELATALAHGGVYRGFGWCNFRRVG